VVSNGVAIFTAQKETISGNIYADNTSVANINLIDTTSLSGIITHASVRMDTSSTWNVTGTSHLVAFADEGSVNTIALTVSNVTGNGFNVYYDPMLPGNVWLAGRSFALINGGCLLPEGSICAGNTNAVATTENKGVRVYPNPAADLLTVAYPASFAGAAVSVTGIDGRVVMSTVLHPGTTSTVINVSGLRIGLYIMTITGDAGRQLIKFTRE